MFRLFCLSILAATAVYDAEKLEVPDVSCASLLGMAVIATPSDELLANSVAAACVWAVYLAVRALCSILKSRVPMGMGDIKLLSILALSMGAAGCFRLFAISGVLSGLAAAALVAMKKAEAGSEIAFVPFMAAAYALMLLEDVDVYVP